MASDRSSSSNRAVALASASSAVAVDDAAHYAIDSGRNWNNCHCDGVTSPSCLSLRKVGSQCQFHF